MNQKLKLSVLIPAYNQSAKELVRGVQRQCETALGNDYEIIVADDGSTDETARQENLQVGEIPQCRCLAADVNRGRAAMRNWLVSEAQGDYMLFIDSDAHLLREDFISRYMAETPTQDVICGGILHPETLPSPSVSLRYRYEKSCEPRFTAEQRNRQPYQCIRSFNFMLPREVAQAYPFDEQIRTYGYEDTLLGRAFERDGVGVRHIDNPLLNADLEDNVTFLEKTRESLHTLHQIESEMTGYSSLLTACSRLKRWHLTKPVGLLFRMFKGMMESNLTGPNPSVRLLQFYKMGYFVENFLP